MRKLLISFIILSFPIQALAECDFSKDIEKLSDGRYAYSVSCHKKVGKISEDLKDREEQVAKLNKTIELKDLAIKFHEERTTNLMNTVVKMEDRVNTIDRLNDFNKWLYFGIGVVVTGGAVWAASQLSHR
jgi:hypothetical protein